MNFAGQEGPVAEKKLSLAKKKTGRGVISRGRSPLGKAGVRLEAPG